MTVYPTNISIPTSSDAETLAWLQNFRDQIVDSPITYGLTSADATDLDTAVTAFRDAWDLAGVEGRTAVNPGSYTQPNRAAMYAARNNALSIARPFAVQIQANPGISDEDKLDAGVVPRNFNRNPLFVPSTAPVISFLQAGIGTHLLAFADETTPSSKRKPFGAAALQLFVGLGSGSLPVNDLRFYQQFSRNPSVVAFDPGDAGQTATYAARWVGRRGDTGPWSASITATVLWSTNGEAA